MTSQWGRYILRHMNHIQPYWLFTSIQPLSIWIPIHTGFVSSHVWWLQAHLGLPRFIQIHPAPAIDLSDGNGSHDRCSTGVERQLFKSLAAVQDMSGYVSIALYHVLYPIKIMISRYIPSGPHHIPWDPMNFPWNPIIDITSLHHSCTKVGCTKCWPAMINNRHIAN